MPVIQATSLYSQIKDYFTLCKPRVVALMLLTMFVGMLLAPMEHEQFPLLTLFWALIGVAFAAGSAAAMNHLLDKHLDLLMRRTQKRPVARGRISSLQAFIFSLILGCIGLFILYAYVNGLTAFLTFLSLIGYAGIYTGYLKHATSQNIVIGGLAGAAPPLLGWTAMTNQLDPQALLLVLIIFTWTPPHFWALAIYRFEEYQKADIPMLPVTHGIRFTTWSIFLYTALLFAVTLLPFIVGMCGFIYLTAVCFLGLRFLWWAFLLYRQQSPSIAFHTFRFSIVYLMGLFIFLLLDHAFLWR